MQMNKQINYLFLFVNRTQKKTKRKMYKTEKTRNSITYILFDLIWFALLFTGENERFSIITA